MEEAGPGGPAFSSEWRSRPENEEKRKTHAVVFRQAGV